MSQEKSHRKIKLSKKIVDGLDHPVAIVDASGKKSSPQYIIWDSELKGFGIRVTPGSKTYVAESRVRGETCRVKIGKHGELTAEQARKEAKTLLGQMARGLNPNKQKLEQRAKSKTLAEVWSEYKEARNLRPNTLYLYEGTLRRSFSDWLSKPVSSITKDMVQQRHKKISANVGPRSNDEGAKALANQAMRFLRSLMNFAASTYEDSDGKPILSENPVNRLSQAKAWNKNKRRKTVITKSQLKPWFDAVQALTHDTTRDFLLLCLFTGLRRNEAASLTWANVNLKEAWLFIAEENVKTGEEHRLPLSDYLVDMLKRRKKAYSSKSPYVFPSFKDPSRYIVECKFSVKKVSDESGVKFMVHDLRRTFLTIGEALDISHYALKRLANHKMSGDVTAGYVVANIERLREPMQAITDFILVQVGQRAPNERDKLADNYQKFQSV